MSVVKTVFVNGIFKSRKVIMEFATIGEATAFCDSFISKNMKEGQICTKKSNGWTVSAPIVIPGWVMNGSDYQKLYSLKLIDSNPFHELLSEIKAVGALQDGRYTIPREDIAIIHDYNQSEEQKNNV